MNNTTTQIRLPDAETQREILAKKRDDHLAIAFNADAEAESIAVQIPLDGGEQEKKDMEFKYRRAAENSRKSAARMQEMLDRLPKPALPNSPFQPPSPAIQ